MNESYLVGMLSWQMTPFNPNPWLFKSMEVSSIKESKEIGWFYDKVLGQWKNLEPTIIYFHKLSNLEFSGVRQVPILVTLNIQEEKIHLYMAYIHVQIVLRSNLIEVLPAIRKQKECYGCSNHLLHVWSCEGKEIHRKHA